MNWTLSIRFSKEQKERPPNNNIRKRLEDRKGSGRKGKRERKRGKGKEGRENREGKVRRGNGLAKRRNKR